MRTTLREDGTRNIVEAMKKTGVKLNQKPLQFLDAAPTETLQQTVLRAAPEL